ncbi:MAG: winged helix-turn-helix domain-containing protein [Eubacteriales bacterium]|nr:winged helix-turn-helix domain-containing protein [Eubacteriales bacterium]
MEPITLTGKKELDIYINPQRQRLLRLMAIAGRPMTPKALSVQMGISASSVQYHLKKLMQLGLVAESHTEKINGIIAHYYRALPRSVNVGFAQADDDHTQRVALMQNGITEVFNGFAAYYNACADQFRGSSQLPPGDILWGISRLKPEEAKELFANIHRFLEEHEQNEHEGDPWEYALIAYPAQEDNHA